jgi:hypothetical protein
MKMLFKGWRREVMDHPHDVIPVTLSGATFHPGEADDPLTWHAALKAFGKVVDMSLNGAFLVEFTFEQEELRNWLRRFVQSKPEAAVRLLSEMQGEAILALAKQVEERASERDLPAPGGSAEPPRENN